MSIFEIVGDMFKELIARIVFLVALCLLAAAVVVVLALVYFATQGHL